MAAGAGHRWGRQAVSTVTIEVGRRSAGMRSLLFGLGAFAILAVSLIVLTGRAGEVSGVWATVRLLAALAAFFVAAPVMLVMGIVAGLRGTFGDGGGRGAAIAGLVLNLALLGLGITIAVLAFTSLGRAA